MLRRSFLSRLTGAATLYGMGQPPSVAASPAAQPAPRDWRAARHSQDDWFDQTPAKHRVIFDTWNSDVFSDALQFAGNYLRVNKDEYGLTEKELSLVICVRHRTAPFAFNDAMWQKYGKAFSRRMQFTDPKTHEAPTANIYGNQLTNIIKQGALLAVCNLTTRAYTRIIAQDTGTDADAVYKELTANTLGTSHFVPAGVVAVTRAQERGYALVSVA